MFDSATDSLLVEQFHFLRPQWLMLFLPLLVLVTLRWKKESQNALHDVLPEHLRKVLLIDNQGWQSHLPLKFLTLGFAIAIVACAGPTWQHLPSPFGEDKAELLIVLDASESMLETDIAPNRLTRAKHKIQSIVEQRNGGKTGLIVFAGTAHTAMPMTSDTKVLLPYLAAISPDIMPKSGKQAETALPIIAEHFTRSTQQAGGTVLFVTDGISPQAISEYQSYFSQSGSQLLVLAVGNQDVAAANMPLDMKALSSLTSKSGGSLIQVSTDNQDVERISRLIEKHLQLNGESDMPWQDMGYYLLFPVALLLLLWFRKGWLVQWVIVGVVLTGFSASPPVMAQPSGTEVHMRVNEAVQGDALNQKKNASQPISSSEKLYRWWMNLWFTPDQQGQRLFNQKDYLAAAKHYQDPFRKGVAYYYASEYQLAYTAFLQAKGSDLALYNAATALARQREYLAAKHLLIEILDEGYIDSNLRRKASQNLAAIEHIIEQIERTSESQANTTEGLEESLELGDNPQTSEGYEETVVSSVLLREKLNANEILGSEELANKWLKRVEADPKRFLAAKFHIQLQSRRDKENDHENR